MVDGIVGVAKLNQSILGPPAVSMNGRARLHMLRNKIRRVGGGGGGGGGGGKGQICLGAGDITDMK